MRPRGEIRAALASAVQQTGGSGITWREAAVHAGVGFDAARMTFENMARAGELVPVGAERAAGRGRALVRYVTTCALPQALDGAMPLCMAMALWPERK